MDDIKKEKLIEFIGEPLTFELIDELKGILDDYDSDYKDDEFKISIYNDIHGEYIEFIITYKDYDLHVFIKCRRFYSKITWFYEGKETSHKFLLGERSDIVIYNRISRVKSAKSCR